MKMIILLSLVFSSVAFSQEDKSSKGSVSSSDEVDVRNKDSVLGISNFNKFNLKNKKNDSLNGYLRKEDIDLGKAFINFDGKKYAFDRVESLNGSMYYYVPPEGKSYDYQGEYRDKGERVDYVVVNQAEGTYSVVMSGGRDESKPTNYKFTLKNDEYIKPAWRSSEPPFKEGGVKLNEGIIGSEEYVEDNPSVRTCKWKQGFFPHKVTGNKSCGGTDSATLCIGYVTCTTKTGGKEEVIDTLAACGVENCHLGGANACRNQEDFGSETMTTYKETSVENSNSSSSGSVNGQ